MKMFNDTIAAVSTPVSKGGIGIIRLSGENSKKITEAIFTGKINESHTIRYGFIFNPESGGKIDEVLVTYMKAPNSYTREDVIEINCHSGVAVLNKIMELVLKNGARQAENGEFTKRAFLNGRIDLTRAEAVIDIINAKTDNAARDAVNRLSGKLYERIKQLTDKLLLCLANIEASIDYPEHDEIAQQRQFLTENIGSIIKSAEALYETADKGRIIKEGIKTVIIGKTNVGKSSLLNYFAGEERAIVTEIHGTTRDTLEESINLNGVLLSLTDTAGIRETDDIVEKIGIDRAKNAARNADLVLAVFDGSRRLEQDELSPEKGAKTLALINKTDLEVKIDIGKINESFGAENVIQISVKNGTGLAELEAKIKQMFFSGEIEEDSGALISGLRQKDALFRSINAMKRALSSLESGFPEDIASIDLMEAYDNLGEITGESIDEDLTDKIFSEFCLGK